MKRGWWLSLVACLALGGCAGGAARHAQVAEGGAAQEAVASQTGGAESLPPRELDEELLYKLLLGDVAAQRGELAISARLYADTAANTRDPRLAQRATQLAIYAHNSTAALRSARLWVELAPRNLEARQSLAALLLRQGQTDEALVQLEQLLALSPRGPGYGFMLVTNVLAREQDKARALAVMDALVAKRGDDADALFAYANLANNADSHELALAQLERVLHLQPGLPRALVLKANVLRQMGQIDTAVETYRQAVENAPQDANLRLGYARMLVEEERIEAAREQFRILGEQMPDNSDVIYAEGLLALQAGELARAEEHFNRLLELGERRDDAAFALGQMSEAAGREEEALRWYRQVAGGNSFVEAAIRTVVILQRREGLGAARAYVQQVVPHTGEQALRLRLVEGEMLREAGQHQAALDVYTAALEEFPGSTELLYARAMNAERMGRIDLLEQDLRAILADDPENVQALNALGYTLADRTDRYQEAYELVQRAYAQRPEDAAIIDSMGWVMYRLGRLEEAEQFLREALKRHFDGEIAAHLVEVLWRAGRQEEARTVWEEARQRAPDHPFLRDIMQRLSQ